MGDRVSFWRRLCRLFRRRELYLRGEERIHYVTISPALQLAAAAFALSMLMVAGSGLVGTALYRDAASSRADALDAAADDYWKLLQSLDALSDRLDASGAGEAAAPGALVRDMLRHEMDRFRTLFPGADLMIAQLDLEQESERSSSAEADRESFKARVADLEGQIASYQSVQATWLLALGVRTKDSIALVEHAVAMTGINVEKLVARAQQNLPSASGGPFVAVVADSGAFSENVGAIASDVGEQVERWEALKRIVRVLPLSAPLDQYRIGSGYGRRQDPINGRRAMHTGLDFNAPVKTPVLSTAPGRVVFAGWHREYGRLVEIDHGFGIRTRYAHLSEISVADGQEVANRARIGLLGSSGRSTGPHLHYEIVVDGKPMNPINFLEAARHVLKG